MKCVAIAMAGHGPGHFDATAKCRQNTEKWAVVGLIVRKSRENPFRVNPAKSLHL